MMRENYWYIYPTEYPTVEALEIESNYIRKPYLYIVIEQ